MPKALTRYDLLVSCPGDIKEELTVINEIVERFNDDYSDALSISIRIRHWSKSAYAESGGKPQALLNEQFIKDCDAAIAIFWTRFGTPTDEYGSGTEEEIALMTEAGKQVFVYFSEVPIPPASVDKVQYEKVIEFKNRYGENGLYFTYDNHETFRKLFTAHLVKYFMSIEALRESKGDKKSSLELKSINAYNDLEEVAVAIPFKADIPIDSIAEMLDQIDSQYERINNYPSIPKKLTSASATENSMLNTSFSNAFRKSVKIDDSMQKHLRKFAELRRIPISDSFFELGNLYRNTIDEINMLGMSNVSLNGSKEEVQKHNNILELHEETCNLINWKRFDDTFSSLKAIKLCIENTGTTYDEDVEVVLKFPRNMILLPENVPFPCHFDINHTDYSYEEIFGIFKTSKFSDYSSSANQNTPTYIPSPQPSGFPFYGSGKSKEEEYYDSLNEVFIYDFFCEGEYVLVKLQIDYIKHNTAVAFPTVLFVTGSTNDIEYQITSKYCESLIRGVLKVINNN